MTATAKCPLGDPCPFQQPEPSSAHPPPEKWLQAAGKLQASSTAGLFKDEEGTQAVGLFLSLADGKSYVVWKDANGGVWKRDVG